MATKPPTSIGTKLSSDNHGIVDDNNRGNLIAKKKRSFWISTLDLNGKNKPLHGSVMGNSSKLPTSEFLSISPSNLSAERLNVSTVSPRDFPIIAMPKQPMWPGPQGLGHGSSQIFTSIFSMSLKSLFFFGTSQYIPMISVNSHVCQITKAPAMYKYIYLEDRITLKFWAGTKKNVKDLFYIKRTFFVLEPRMLV